MFAKMFPGAMEASFHRGNACRQDFGDFGMTVPFLNQRQQCAILRPELG